MGYQKFDRAYKILNKAVDDLCRKRGGADHTTTIEVNYAKLQDLLNGYEELRSLRDALARVRKAVCAAGEIEKWNQD